MASETTGVGIVGCGNISTTYLENVPLFKGVEIRAIADARPEAALAQAEKFGVEAVGVDDLLARKDIGIVVNLTVPAAHAEVSLAALAAGKHVFSEKPLATNLALGRTIIAEAEKRVRAYQETGIDAIFLAGASKREEVEAEEAQAEAGG